MADHTVTSQAPPAEKPIHEHPQDHIKEKPTSSEVPSYQVAAGQLNADLAYEEAIELEYAKREGGA
ncbi:hypothetical protein HDU86_002150 [Geranomyces michiganensis]|nr:hypothetical protein HDU86_002150 [Geranomyces michiganensis]